MRLTRPSPVRLANLMKVLTSDAIQDPTRVEARVRREVAMRKHTHEKMNSERKLTDEQRREKKENKKVDEEKKGIFGAVYKYVHPYPGFLFRLDPDFAIAFFRVMILSDPSHQFKVRKNAEQNNLTGVCIFNPSFNLVYVEGAAKFMKSYKKLMTRRIVWTEAARSRGGADDIEIDGPDSDVEGEQGGSNTAKDKGKAKAEGEEETAKSLEDNKCILVWEGTLRDREYSSFRAKSCPTDREAKEFLGENLKGYWDVAKNWKPEDEDLY